MKKDRRDFIRKAGLVGFLGTTAGISEVIGRLSDANSISEGKIIKIKSKSFGNYFVPLNKIVLGAGPIGTIMVMDGNGSTYFSGPASDNVEFFIGGAIGTHLVILKDKKDKLLDMAAFRVDAKTAISDKSGEFRKIADMLYFELSQTNYGLAHVVRLKDKPYHYFSSWFQDHMYVMQAQKYFYPELKSGIDLYFEGQREDGMFHDNYKHKWEENGPWSRRFDYGNFVTVPTDKKSSAIFVRIPIENIAEFSMIEGTYYTWKAVGDSQWMKEKLDGLLKGVKYITTDPYRWSEKFQLIKKGYAIDIWDFQNEYDAALVGNDAMKVELGKTPFGIMFADNVRMAYSCRLLAEMLEYHNRNDEAQKMRSLGKELKERIDKLSWNGQFYTHWIPEDSSYNNDFGVDEKSQVTISNAYALNHGATHEQCVSIIKTYQRIRNEMPKTSPGEWYCCYPPFEKGWGKHSKWTYMNGGVSPITAGQLLLGALEHGYEEYGIDILRRVNALADKMGRLLGGYRGAFPDAPVRNFSAVNIQPVVNADFYGRGAPGVPGWTNEGENDLHNMPTGKQVFHDIPFNVIDPANNNRRACLILSGDKGYKISAEIPVKNKGKSLYLLHASNRNSSPGYITFHYTDKTSTTIAVSGEIIGNWWNPASQSSDKPTVKVAWSGPNAVNKNVGVYVAGIELPNSDKTVEKLELIGPRDNAKWMILGITLSDEEVYFMPEHRNSIPSHWAAAECYYALMEGLCGIKDLGIAYNKALIAPRWEAAGTDEAEVTARYEASVGYVSYKYKKISANEMQILFTGSSAETQIQMLLPKNKKAVSVLLNNVPVAFENKSIEQSNYAIINTRNTGVNELRIKV